MRLIELAAVVVAGVVLIPAGPSPASLYPDLSREVVKIIAFTRYVEDGSVQGATGSGVILGNKGRVVTAAHVVFHRKTFIALTTDGKRVGCRVLAEDHDSDLALLACDGLSGVRGVSHIDSGTLRNGSRVVAAGYPGMLPLTVTDGITSAVNGVRLFVSVPVGPGMSGGGLFLYDGTLVGITSALYQDNPFTGVFVHPLALQAFLRGRYVSD